MPGIVIVDATQVPCPGFVGETETLDGLAITSAREGLDNITDQAGAIFVAPAETTGLPTSRWGSSTINPEWLTPKKEETVA